MTKARMDGAILVFLGASVLFLLSSYMLATKDGNKFQDFRHEYYAARCLLSGQDLYNPAAMYHTYSVDEAARPPVGAEDRLVLTHIIYPPSSFAVTIPFALMPWQSARVLWLFASSGGLLFVSFLILDLVPNHAATMAGALIGLLLINTEVLIALANPSAIAISLCLCAVWTFLRDRYAITGVLCLALSLALKPQLVGFIWLYFLLAGGKLRKRAIQALLVTVAISIPTTVYLTHIAPNWPNELRSNLQIYTNHGGLDNPASRLAGHERLDLQVIVSYFKDVPAFYKSVSFLIFLPLLSVWVASILRAPSSLENHLLALAATAPLTLLPVIHHPYDSKLFLLMVPATAWLWTRTKWLGRISCLLTAATFLATGDISSSVWSLILRSVPEAPGSIANSLMDATMALTAPVVVLGSCIFFLWLYWRGARTTVALSSHVTATEAGSV